MQHRALLHQTDLSAAGRRLAAALTLQPPLTISTMLMRQPAVYIGGYYTTPILVLKVAAKVAALNQDWVPARSQS